MAPRSSLSLLTCLAALVLAACGGGGDDGAPAPASGARDRPVVTFATKNFTEQFILGELYAQALRAKGFRVRLKPNIGSSEIIDKTLTGGSIDGYAEYTGVIAVELAKARTRLSSARQTYDVAKRFQASRGMAMLEPTPFFDVLALAVRPAYAERHRLRTIGDLRRLKSFVYGGAPENETRFQGLLGMRRVYRLTNARFRPVTIGEQYKALDSGKADVINVLSTEGQLRGGRYVVLEDTRRIFGFQNVAPVIRASVLRRQGPEFAATLNAVSARLTNEVMQDMNGAVDLDGRRPRDVARSFLEREGLL